MFITCILVSLERAVSIASVRIRWHLVWWANKALQLGVLPTLLRLRAYRANVPSEKGYIGNEPCVIYAADKPPFGDDGDDNNPSRGEHVPIRVHDQCLTSEVFGWRRCDCREQLVYALQYVSQNGGAVIYLQQEGCGIGLANKVAAYALQDLGMDTVNAR